MNLYTTSLTAIRPSDKELIKYCGPHVPGISFADAQAYCERECMGYLTVTGKLVAEIDFESGERIDFDQQQLN